MLAISTTQALRGSAVLLSGTLIALLALAETANAEAQNDPAPATPNEPGVGGAAGDAADLAKKLSNPIAAMISLPIQTNYDFGMGPNDDGWQVKTNIQPVIPVDISKDWNLISRTIVPVVFQKNIAGGPGASQSGLGDIQQALFFSPKTPTSGGLIWGAGPVILLPTATDDLIGAGKWGIGPNAVVLTQQGHWTFGALVNHIWSFAGDDSRAGVSSTYMQPFVSYTTRRATTFGANLETSYNWKAENWNVPLNLTAAQLLPPKVTGLPMPIQLQIGYRVYLESPGPRPDGGLRFTITALFAK